MKQTKTFSLALTGMLIAVGIVIPMFSPIKIVIEPASFTLASHVAVFIAMFISPSVAVAVSLGTTLGFFLGGFPLTVVLRALTHVIFALAGSICRPPYVTENPPAGPGRPAHGPGCRPGPGACPGTGGCFSPQRGRRARRRCGIRGRKFPNPPGSPPGQTGQDPG